MYMYIFMFLFTFMVMFVFVFVVRARVCGGRVRRGHVRGGCVHVYVGVVSTSTSTSTSNVHCPFSWLCSCSCSWSCQMSGPLEMAQNMDRNIKTPMFLWFLKCVMLFFCLEHNTLKRPIMCFARQKNKLPHFKNQRYIRNYNTTLLKKVPLESNKIYQWIKVKICEWLRIINLKTLQCWRIGRILIRTRNK
jgi:hypothetical protein